MFAILVEALFVSLCTFAGHLSFPKVGLRRLNIPEYYPILACRLPFSLLLEGASTLSVLHSTSESSSPDPDIEELKYEPTK